MICESCEKPCDFEYVEELYNGQPFLVEASTCCHAAVITEEGEDERED